VRLGDRGDPVVGPRGQVDDHAIDVGERSRETARRSDRDRDGAGSPYEVGQACRPDEVVGQDRDPGGQSNDSAR
jgi:hypothetical protein